MIENPKRCNICNGDVRYVDSSVVYGRSYWMIYQCTKCWARVWVHKGTNRALGILADHQLRELKKQCHYWFDKEWKSWTSSRRNAYAKLAKELSIDIKECHIWYFDKSMCNKVLELYSNV